MTAVRALWWSDGALHLIDQRGLPGRTQILHLRRVEPLAEAIRTLTVRGAPSIGVAAAFGMVLAARQGGYSADRAARLLAGTRPTARDLFVGIERVRAAWSAGEDPLAAAEAYRAEIVAECRQLGDAGAPLVARAPRVLTHCNAGALATVEWGTALAPIRVAHAAGHPVFVWVDETRPLLQGARLTAWELARERIPHTVIADNASGHFMHRGEVDCVLVGADRIARNGDVANKIGTYEKAVLARENHLPFYVAAPWSTFDPDLADGTGIIIEERGDGELRGTGRRRVIPAGSPVRNPAFDVTPARLVTAFITPDGVLPPARIARALQRHRRGVGPTPN
ncbi:MAG: S-methyl-5-thioribose-1-phosphate isomerase [Thermoplasmata archaeon]